MSRALDIRTWWHPSVTTVCMTTDPEIWFPARGYETSALAKELCSHCPEMADCLAYADRIRPEAGIWGGISFPRRRT